MTTEDASKWYTEHNRVFTQWSFGLRRFWITSIWQSRLVDVQSTKGPLETKLLQRWSKMTCQKQLWSDAICIPWKFRCRWILQKKGFDPLWGNQFVDPWPPKAPVLWEYLRKETPNKESHFHSILSGVSFKVGQANSVLFSRTYAQCEDCPRSAGQMANMTSCAGVKESHQCQRNKQNQWLLAISLANGAIQLQLATHSAQLRCSWFEHFGFKAVFFFLHKEFWRRLKVFCSDHRKSPYVPLCFLRWLGEVQNAWVTLR